MTTADLAHDTHDMTMGHARLKVGGMTCSACVGHVEKALKAVPGVTAATVNLGTEQADVNFDAGVEIAELGRAVAGAGYDVIADEVTLSVSGMTCSACVGHVEKALKKVPGVKPRMQPWRRCGPSYPNCQVCSTNLLDRP